MVISATTGSRPRAAAGGPARPRRARRRPGPALAAIAVLLAWGLVEARAARPGDRLEAALARLREGEVVAAREILLEILADDPTNGTARFHLGRLALDRDRWAEAAEHLEVAVAFELPRPFAAWHLLGRARLLGGDAGGAREALDRALERAPRFAPALVERARAAIVLGDDAAALEDLSRASLEAEGGDEAPRLAGALLLCLGRDREAARALASAAVRDPAADFLRLALEDNCALDGPLGARLGGALESADAHLALGLSCLRAGRAAPALAALRIAREIDDRNPVSGRCLERLTGEPAAASRPPPHPLLAEEMAGAERLYEEGRFAEAAPIAARVLQARPHHLPAALLLLRDAERRGDLWAVLEGYHRLAGWLPAVAALRLRLARVALALGAHSLAGCEAGRLLEAAPEEAEVWFLRAAALAEGEDTAAAVEAARRAVALGYRTPRAFLTLGDLLHRQMRIAESIAAYAEAVRLDATAAESIASFALSTLTGDEIAALRPLLERHVEEDPAAVNSLYGLGVMALRQDELETARGHLERVAELAPGHAQVHYNLALLHRQRGDLEASRRSMARFQQLDAERSEEWREHHRAHQQRLEARAAAAAGDPRTALGLLAELASAGTAELEDYLAAGEAALAAGEAAAAAGWFESVLAARPAQREAMAGLAASLRARGRSEEAERLERRLALATAPCAEALLARPSHQRP